MNDDIGYCIVCGEPFIKIKNKKYCSISCSNQNRHTSELTRSKIRESLKKRTIIYTRTCIVCDTEFTVNESSKKRFCSCSCSVTHSNKNRKLTSTTKSKISKSLTKPPLIKICKYCNTSFIASRKSRMFCSPSCSSFYRMNTPEAKKRASDVARKTMSVMGKRSKNEIYFSELCERSFNNVLTNEPIFNGWDADVILQDEKIAILWNGIWHYKKLFEKHTLSQIQNRDRIKIEEIKKYGYIPYVIKDTGRYNKIFVEDEFNKLWSRIRSDS